MTESWRMAIFNPIVHNKMRVMYHSSHSIRGKIQRVQRLKASLERGSAEQDALDFPV
jgi:hypothetical protein